MYIGSSSRSARCGGNCKNGHQSPYFEFGADTYGPLGPLATARRRSPPLAKVGPSPSIAKGQAENPGTLRTGPPIHVRVHARVRSRVCVRNRVHAH